MSIGRTWDFLTPARHSSNIVLNMGIKVDWMTAFALASDPALNNVTARSVIAPLCNTWSYWTELQDGVRSFSQRRGSF